MIYRSKTLMGKSVYVISLVRVRWLSLAHEPTNNSFTEIGQLVWRSRPYHGQCTPARVQELCGSDLMFDKDYRSLKLMLQT